MRIVNGRKIPEAVDFANMGDSAKLFDNIGNILEEVSSLLGSVVDGDDLAADAGVFAGALSVTGLITGSAGLSLTGNATISGVATSAGVVSTNGISVNAGTISVSATQALAGGLNISGGVTVGGAAVASGTLRATGLLTALAGINVTGGVLSTGTLIASTGVSINATGISIIDGAALIAGTVTGLKIASANDQKISIWGTTPTIQPSSASVGALSITGGTYGFADETERLALTDKVEAIDTMLKLIGLYRVTA